MKPLGKSSFRIGKMVISRERLKREGGGGEGGFASYGEPKGGGHHTLFKPNLGHGTEGQKENTFFKFKHGINFGVRMQGYLIESKLRCNNLVEN